MDVDDMALALQGQYSEYARRKRAAFKALVSNGWSHNVCNIRGVVLCMCVYVFFQCIVHWRGRRL